MRFVPVKSAEAQAEAELDRKLTALNRANPSMCGSSDRGGISPPGSSDTGGNRNPSRPMNSPRHTSAL